MEVEAKQPEKKRFWISTGKSPYFSEGMGFCMHIFIPYSAWDSYSLATDNRVLVFCILLRKLRRDSPTHARYCGEMAEENTSSEETEFEKGINANYYNK